MRVAKLAYLLLSFCHADANGPVCSRATGRLTLYPFVGPSITPLCIEFRWTWSWQSSTKNQGGTRMRFQRKAQSGSCNSCQRLLCDSACAIGFARTRTFAEELLILLG